MPTPLLMLTFAPQAARAKTADVPNERFPVRWVEAKKVWEVDARPHGRIRSVLFPGSETPVKLLHKDWADEVRSVILRDIEVKHVPEKIAVAPYLPREWLLERWVEKWIEHLEGQVARGERSPTYLRRLRDFTRKGGAFSPLYGQSIHSIDFADLEDYAIRLRDGGASATTTVHVLSSLRTCLRWVAKRSGRTYACPPFPELQRGEHEPTILTPEQQTAVLEQIDEAKRGAFLAMADLMIRPGEARAANAEDYDWKTRELRVEHAIQGSRKDARRGPTKGRDRRQLVVTERLAAWLDEHVSAEARLRGTVPLFQNPEGVGEDRRWPESSLRHVWEAAARAAGGPVPGLYVGCKHSTATWLRRAGLSLDELAVAMGHSWASRGKAVTEGYAQAPRLANETIVRLLDGRGR